MKRSCYWLVSLAIMLLIPTRASAQNLLANPGFESPTSDSTSTGNWFRFGSGINALATDATTTPHTGQGHMSLNTVGASQFAGVFQLLPVAINPGQVVTFTGWHKTTTTPFNGTVELKIEWTGAPQNRIDVLALGSDYTQFTHTGIAPVGATGATITYALSSFGAGQNGNMQVFVDDLEAVVVPEPVTVSLLGVALLAGRHCFRRRK